MPMPAGSIHNLSTPTPQTQQQRTATALDPRVANMPTAPAAQPQYYHPTTNFAAPDYRASHPSSQVTLPQFALDWMRQYSPVAGGERRNMGSISDLQIQQYFNRMHPPGAAPVPGAVP